MDALGNKNDGYESLRPKIVLFARTFEEKTRTRGSKSSFEIGALFTFTSMLMLNSKYDIYFNRLLRHHKWPGQI